MPEQFFRLEQKERVSFQVNEAGRVGREPPFLIIFLGDEQGRWIKRALA